MAKNELISLALLTIKPMHAYAINQILEGMKLEAWAHISRVSIYAALKRLEKNGAVTVTFEKPDNMPERKVFNLTNIGKRLLEEELFTALSTMTSDDILFNLGMSLCFGLSASKALEAAEKRIIALQNFREDTQNKFQCKKDGEHPYIPAKICLRGSMKHLQILLETTNEFITFLKEEPDFYEKAKKAFYAEFQ